MVRKLVIRTAAAAIALATAGTAHAAVTLYGLTNDNQGRNLVSFSSEMPGTFSSNVAITGDVNAGIDLLALDLNTSNNQLYALGQVGRGQYALFQIATTGVATRVGGANATLGVNIASENVGLDYDPTGNNGAGVFRVVTNDEQLFTVNPTTGQGTLVGAFAYAPGDTRGDPTNPNVVGAAFNGDYYVLDRTVSGVQNSLLSTLTGTTLNSRAVVPVRIGNSASFDIAFNGEAYFNSGLQADRLYQLNLANGSVVDKGALQLQLTGLTAAPGRVTSPVPEPATWAMMLLGFGTLGFALRRPGRVETRIRFS